MKQFLTISSLCLGIYFLLGVCLVQASQPSAANPWISFTEPKEQFKASFPYSPVHMQFELTQQDALNNGSLNVYSASSSEGVMMVNTITSPSLVPYNEQGLSEELLKKVFYSCFARRLFYQPKVFKDNPFNIKKTNIQGHPALEFSTVYRHHQQKEQLSGIAILKENKLYMIFYLTEEQKKAEGLQQFIQSFQLIS